MYKCNLLEQATLSDGTAMEAGSLRYYSLTSGECFFDSLHAFVLFVNLILYVLSTIFQL